jgi:DNA polymerase III alpha subunit
VKYPEMFEIGERIEGKIRNAGVHAAGTIITPDR